MENSTFFPNKIGKGEGMIIGGQKYHGFFTHQIKILYFRFFWSDACPLFNCMYVPVTDLNLTFKCSLRIWEFYDSILLMSSKSEISVEDVGFCLSWIYGFTSCTGKNYVDVLPHGEMPFLPLLPRLPCAWGFLRHQGHLGLEKCQRWKHQLGHAFILLVYIWLKSKKISVHGEDIS